MKRVLVLGAGFVVKPLLDELARLPEVAVDLAALNIERAEALVAERPRARALALDVADRERLSEGVAAARVVVSLLPADRHAAVAEVCVEHRVPLVTTSYVSAAMAALDPRARERGVLLLNETGLDPGIDHALAAARIRQVAAAGGRVVSFASYCGGLPAPEANANPWGYKLAWSPRGVLLAARSPVRYLEGGEVVEEPSAFRRHPPRTLTVPGVGRLEAYPARDSLPYREPYGLSDPRDLVRGSLRYPGWCATFRALLELGLLDLEPGHATLRDLLDRQAPGSGDLRQRLARRLGPAVDDGVLARLAWLGLLADPPAPGEPTAPLDLLARLLEGKLRYAPGERDMVVLEEHLLVAHEDGGRRCIRERLLVFGQAGDDSAMARTVGLPAAIACRLILEDRVRLSGVHIPVSPQLAEPILAGLAARGLRFEVEDEPVASP